MGDAPVAHTGCCDPFDPAPWEDQLLTWENKRFVTDRVAAFLHIPLNMGRVVTRNMARIVAAGAKAPQQLMLTDENSLWGADIFIDVAKDVPGARMTSLSGTFRTRVFEGPYSMVGAWMKEMAAFVAAKGETVSKLYASYTTCPRCAKAYGKNYVVLFAQLDSERATPSP